MIENMLMAKSVADNFVSTAVLALAMDFETYPPKDLSKTTRSVTNFGGTNGSPNPALQGLALSIGPNGTAYVRTVDAPELQLSDDFTVEYWLLGGNSVSYLQIAINKSTVTNASNIGSNNGYPYMTGDDGSVVFQSPNIIPNATTWIHHCYTRKNGVLRYKRNGVTDTEVSWAGTWGVNTGQLYIGNSASTGGHTTVNGYMDRLRIWQGCKYWPNFTPVSAAYPAA